MSVLKIWITAVLCLGLMQACSRQAADQKKSPVHGGTARISLQSANDLLFPLLIQESNLRQISERILNPTLITYRGDDDPNGVLVSAWQVGTENTSITYILNSANRWSNGRAISSQDVAYTVMVMQSPYFSSRIPERYKVIRDVDIFDSLSFRSLIFRRLTVLRDPSVESTTFVSP